TIPVNSTLVGIETFPGFALASVIGDGNGVVTILGRSKSNPNAFGMWVVTVVGKETLKPDKLVTSTTGDPCQGELVLKSPNQNGLDYQWFLNSLKIRGADQPNYRAVVSGSYTLIVLTDGNVAETYPPFNVSISNIVVPTISGVGSPITLITSSRDVASNTSDTITQWYLNNRLIRGATGRKLDIYYNGKYYATNKSGNCRIQSNILEVNEPNYVNLQRSGLIYTDSTIENYSNGPIGNSINIYPNPTSGLYNLDYYTSSKIGLSYQIFNYMGQTVVERTLTKVSIGLQTDSFDLSVFGKGIYYISINEENHKSKCIKIVVQ
ncbi:MAG: T9SS type A sorting domain-containing protein, partial [Bacteroidota bacterium]|nr:T9SS type A sorting domain-containing protein [Bacteroidota bacterium]